MSLVLGIGLRASAKISAFYEVAERLGAPSDCIVALPASRADFPLSQALRSEGRRLILIEAEALSGVETVSQSPRSLAHYGTGSVAEACALIACALTSGGPAEIWAPSITSSDRSVTAALAGTKKATLPRFPTERALS